MKRKEICNFKCTTKAIKRHVLPSFPLGESYFKTIFIILRNNGLNNITYLSLLMTKYKESKATNKHPNYCQTLHCKSHSYKNVFIYITLWELQ